MSDVFDQPMTDKRADSIAEYLDSKIELLVDDVTVAQVNGSDLVEYISDSHTLEDIDGYELTENAIEKITPHIDVGALLHDFKKDLRSVLSGAQTDYYGWRDIWGTDEEA